MARSRGRRLVLHSVLFGLAGGAVISGPAFFDGSGDVSYQLSAVPSMSFSGVVVGVDMDRAMFEARLQPSPSLRTAPSASISNSISQHTRAQATGSASTDALDSSISTAVVRAASSAAVGAGGVQPLADLVDPVEPFVFYDIQADDSASQIAERFGIELRTLLENNPHLGDGELLALGQQLIVPREDGILYRIGYGDSLESILGQFDNVELASVLAYRPNRVRGNSDLVVGNHLLLPGARVKPPPPSPLPSPSDSRQPPDANPTTGEGQFSLPLAWWNAVTDAFGVPRGGGTYHTGIDLGLYGANGIPIVSACDGVVIRVEYLTYSYGYHVIVDCGDGWTTLYAHLSRIDAAVGQTVSQGTQLGLSGNTGFSTGEHLHFEIRRNGAFLDPSEYLPF